MPGSNKRKNQTQWTLEKTPYTDYEAYKKALATDICKLISSSTDEMKTVTETGKLKEDFCEAIICIPQLAKFFILQINKDSKDKSGSVDYFKRIITACEVCDEDGKIKIYDSPAALAEDIKKTGKAFEKTKGPMWSWNTALVNIKTKDGTIVENMKKFGKILQSEKLLKKIKAIKPEVLKTKSEESKQTIDSMLQQLKI